MAHFERIGSEEVWRGRIASATAARFRYDDGEEAEREIVSTAASASILAHDGEHLYLVVQPREAVDEQALVELPAGKLDVEGEGPLETAKRELAEEIGKGARSWRHVKTCYSSPGFCDEVMHLFLATDLYDEEVETDSSERIEIRTVPLDRLDDVIVQCRDAKTLIGLLWLRAYRA